MSERFAMGTVAFKRYKTMGAIGMKVIDIPMATTTDGMVVVTCQTEGVSIEYNPRIKGFTITVK